MPCVPHPMYAIVILSFGATRPRPPSTWLGTMVNAATPAAAPAAVVRNSRRLMSSLGAMVTLSLGIGLGTGRSGSTSRAGYATPILPRPQQRSDTAVKHRGQTRGQTLGQTLGSDT